MDWRPWMDAFLPPLLEALPGRVAFVGIQGSFGRGEAGPESDVDLVVVLDALGAAELAACRGVLEKMPFADRACGFFCDRAALAAWPAFDALQKAAFLALRLAHCRRSGQYTAARQSLLPKLEPEERALLGKDCTLPALMAWARGEMES